jgi:hypothetical protein
MADATASGTDHPQGGTLMQSFEALKKRIVNLANDNEAVMDGTMKPVLNILADNEIVFAVWQDMAAPDGVGILIVKGQKLLMECVSSRRSIRSCVSAIKCVEEAQAVALAHLHGDPNPLG